MSYIKKLRIYGFKRFEEFEIEFNERVSIIVGSNESGKSTILEAIDIIINQKYKNFDKHIIEDLLNIENIKAFKDNPKIENLPSICLEIDLDLMDDLNGENYYGLNFRNSRNEPKFGIKFICEFNKDEFADDLREQIENGIIPIEYYTLSWITYAGQYYNVLRKPVKNILIDTSKIDSSSSFNYYNKTIFNNKYTSKDIMSSKQRFRDNIKTVFTNLSLNDIEENRKFGINEKKVILENIISVYDNEILLENKGSGMENLIKTEIALDKEKNKIDVALIEEPENHLSHENLLKMISQISSELNNGQLIITTHNDLIASRIGLTNIIWISKNKSISLKSIDKNTSKYFQKLDSNNLLQFLLSDKVILVEGATEYLLFPKLYKQVTNNSIEQDKISIISCRSLSFARFFEVAKKMNKKVAVITDNDAKTRKIDDSKENNNQNKYCKIYMDKNVENWTWEVCFYKLNSFKLSEIIPIESGSDYEYHNAELNERYHGVLGKILKNKVDTAFKILEEDYKFEIPTYVNEAISWIRK